MLLPLLLLLEKKEIKTRVRTNCGLEIIDTLIVALLWFSLWLACESVCKLTRRMDTNEAEFLLENEPNFIRADDAIELISLNGADLHRLTTWDHLNS